MRYARQTPQFWSGFSVKLLGFRLSRPLVVTHCTSAAKNILDSSEEELATVKPLNPKPPY